MYTQGYKANDQKQGMTLGEIRQWVNSLDGAPDQIFIKSVTGFRSQLQLVKVEWEEEDGLTRAGPGGDPI